MSLKYFWPSETCEQSEGNFSGTVPLGPRSISCEAMHHPASTLLHWDKIWYCFKCTLRSFSSPLAFHKYLQMIFLSICHNTLFVWLHWCVGPAGTGFNEKPYYKEDVLWFCMPLCILFYLRGYCVMASISIILINLTFLLCQKHQAFLLLRQ